MQKGGNWEEMRLEPGIKETILSKWTGGDSMSSVEGDGQRREEHSIDTQNSFN